MSDYVGSLKGAEARTVLHWVRTCCLSPRHPRALAHYHIKLVFRVSVLARFSGDRSLLLSAVIKSNLFVLGLCGVQDSMQHLATRASIDAEWLVNRPTV